MKGHYAAVFVWVVH